MSLHRRRDKEPDIDPDDGDETIGYIWAAEEKWCSGLCDRCGLKHRPAACPTVNMMTLKSDDER